MIKDLVVNLSVAPIRDVAGEFAVSIAAAFEAHVAGVAFVYEPAPPMLTMGGGDEQPGVKLLAAWYERNLAICARLLQAVKPGDRVVAFYGQGHIYLLQQCLREQPTVQLVDPLSYLAGT